MDIRDLALASTIVPRKASTGPWDWEAACKMPNLGIVDTCTAVASWLASKFTVPTIPALRVAHA